MFANLFRIGCDANEKKLICANFLLVIITAAYIAIFVMKMKSMFSDGASNDDFSLQCFNFYILTEGPSVTIDQTKQPFVAVLRGREDRKFPKKSVDALVFIFETVHCRDGIGLS